MSTPPPLAFIHRFLKEIPPRKSDQAKAMGRRARAAYSRIGAGELHWFVERTSLFRVSTFRGACHFSLLFEKSPRKRYTKTTD